MYLNSIPYLPSLLVTVPATPSLPFLAELVTCSTLHTTLGRIKLVILEASQHAAPGLSCSNDEEDGPELGLPLRTVHSASSQKPGSYNPRTSSTTYHIFGGYYANQLSITAGSRGEDDHSTRGGWVS